MAPRPRPFLYVDTDVASYSNYREYMAEQENRTLNPPNTPATTQDGNPFVQGSLGGSDVDIDPTFIPPFPVEYIRNLLALELAKILESITSTREHYHADTTTPSSASSPAFNAYSTTFDHGTHLVTWTVTRPAPLTQPDNPSTSSRTLPTQRDTSHHTSRHNELTVEGALDQLIQQRDPAQPRLGGITVTTERQVEVFQPTVSAQPKRLRNPVKRKPVPKM